MNTYAPASNRRSDRGAVLRRTALGGMIALLIAAAAGRAGTAQAPPEAELPLIRGIEQICAGAPRTSQLVRTSIMSQHLPGDHDVYVYLPPNYCANATTRYPSLYLLHGGPGNARDWIDAGTVHTIADQMIADGALPPLVIVMPDGNDAAINDTQWVNGNAAAGFGQAETYVIDELLPFIDAHVRTDTSRQARAIGGLSAGGYGALNIAAHHSDLFGTAAIMSGFFRALPTDQGIDLFAGDAALAYHNSPLDRLDETHAVQQLALYFDVGSDDPWFVDDAHQLNAELTARQIPHEFHVYAGTHDWVYWRTHLPDVLRFVGQHVAAKTPGRT